MKKKVFLLILLLCWLALGGFPAYGQEGPVSLKSTELKNQFPEGVLFQVAAETTAPEKIKEIKLEVRVKGSSRASYAYLEFEPDALVQGNYLLRTGGAQYKPPGTMLEYRFIILDSAGRNLETKPETFLYIDSRFQWEKVSDGLLEVYYYYAPIKARAELVLKASVDTVKKMGALLGVAPAQPIRVIGYNNYSQMASALPFQSRTTQTELQTQGQAFYEYGVLLEFIGDPRADGIASHELTHMVVGEATKGAFVDIPTWLNEGLAEYANVNPGYSHAALLDEAISQKQLSPLRHMQAMPGKPREILLFYGQARSVVTFLIDTYGEDKLRALFAAFKQGLRIDEALKSVYGFDQDGLDNAWRQSLGLPPLEPASAPPALAVTPINWRLIGGIIAAGGIIIAVVGWRVVARSRSH